MKSDINILGIKLFGHHGVYESEALNGQEFLVDLKISYHAGEASKSDQLAQAVDYFDLVTYLCEIFDQERCALLEKLSDVLINKILEKYQLICDIEISIHKPEIKFPVPVNDFYYTAKRSR